MLFSSLTLKPNFQPNINLDGCAIKFVSDVTYLGVCLNHYYKDDADINRQVRYYIVQPTPLDLYFIDALN